MLLIRWGKNSVLLKMWMLLYSTLVDRSGCLFFHLIVSWVFKFPQTNALILSLMCIYIVAHWSCIIYLIKMLIGNVFFSCAQPSGWNLKETSLPTGWLCLVSLNIYPASVFCIVTLRLRILCCWLNLSIRCSGLWRIWDPGASTKFCKTC